MTNNAVVIFSGGMDSTVLIYYLHHEDYKIHALSFDYGQKHKKELDFAKLTATKLGIQHDIVDLSSITKLLKGSALTDNIEVPEGHYASENMKTTVVPNRNAIMLSIAFGVAVAEDSEIVATAVHAGDHFIYPDCRPRFITSFDLMQSIAIEGFANEKLKLYAPFVELGKHDIVRIGDMLNVPFEDTWSCYKGQEYHCGKCGTCVERIEAFELSEVKDPTIYKK